MILWEREAESITSQIIFIMLYQLNNWSTRLGKKLMKSRLCSMINPLKLFFVKYSKMTIKSPTFIVITANFFIFNIFVTWSVFFFSYLYNNRINLAVTETPSANLSSSGAQNVDNSQNEQIEENIFRIPDDIRKIINKNKMILVMDLDETMVFTRRKKAPRHENYAILDKDGNITYVEFRPHIAQFLSAVSELFTIYVYTAGTQQYADPVLNLLPNSEVISKRFYRESCVHHKGNLIKDLKVIKKSIGSNQKQKLAILVDDNGLSISYNHPHSIRIRAFEGNQQDKYLQQIFKILLEYYRKYCQIPTNNIK